MLVGCSKRILSLPRSCSISSRELYCKSAYRGLKRSEWLHERYFSKDAGDGKQGDKTGDSKKSSSDELDDIFEVTVKQEDQEAAERRAKEAKERKPKSATPSKPEIPKQVEEQLVKEFEKAVSGSAAQSILEKYGLTKHHISVLSACSVSTQRLHAGPVERFGPIPIEKRVIGYIHLDILDVPLPVKAAIRRMTGQHYKGDFVKLACEKYPTSIENLVHVIWTMETIVRTAKESVGIQVDRTPLSSWSELMQCVESTGYGKQTIDYLNMSYERSRPMEKQS
jgi:hypothetical protein